MTQASKRYALHAYFMQRALELAYRGWYGTRPNPRVGCVVVRAERIIGEGWHERAGEAHAERRALADVERRGHSARGATVYVTLEPCSHIGRTGPCVDALIEAGVACVVIASRDPNPAIDGRGMTRLRDAGIAVVEDVLNQPCTELNAGFNCRMQLGRPRVRVKLAMSLDGRTAAANGESRWITGDGARDDVHRLRAECGAVMTGRGTALADDPSLNVRLSGDWLQPLRVVLDSRLALPATARMLALDGDTLIYTASHDAERIAALEAAGARVQSVQSVQEDTAGVKLEVVLAALGAAEINDVLVEAGPTLAGALAEAGLIDQYIFYMAPRLLGDKARGLLHMPGADTLADARDLVIDAVDPVGADWRITARPR